MITQAGWVLWATAAGAAVWFWLAFARSGPSWRKSTVKTVAVGALALAALAQGAGPLVVLALALGALGDLALSRPGGFVAGLVAFLAGHLVWAAALLRAPQADLAAIPWPVAALLVAFVLAVAARFWRPAGPLRGPVAAYALAIGAMAGCAFSWPMPHVVQGAVLVFLASDLLLAGGLFLLSPDDHRQGPIALAVWPLYWLAQAGLFGALALSNPGASV